MNRFIFAFVCSASFSLVAWADDPKPGREAYLKSVKGEQLEGLMANYRHLLDRATSYSARSILTDDLTYLINNFQNYEGIDNRKATKEALENLMTAARWKKLEAWERERDADQLIRVDETLTSTQKDEKLERLQGERLGKLDTIIAAIIKAAKEGWPLRPKKKK